MSLTAVLDVAVGLAFTYFLLALIASGLQELIAGVFQWRGTYLSKAINVIIDDSPQAAFGWAGVWNFLTAHFTWMTPPTPASPSPAFPAPGANQKDAATLARERIAALQSHPLIRGSPTGLPSYVPSRNFALALLEALRDGSQLPLLSQAERMVLLLPDGDLKRTLSMFLQQAGGDLDSFRAQVERWFDDAMDRLSGIYARISQYMLLVLGLALAVSMNVDSFRLARTLWEDPSLRGAIATAAEQAAAQPPPADQANGSASNGAEPGGSRTNGPATPGSPTPGQSAAPTPRDAYKTLMGQNLPIGWSRGPQPDGPGGFPGVLLGWLFTAAAVALGAPFWFSVLQQFANLRNAGPKPASSTSSDTAARPST